MTARARKSQSEERQRLIRLSRQVHHDQQFRPPPPISLPRITCLEDGASPDDADDEPVRAA